MLRLVLPTTKYQKSFMAFARDLEKEGKLSKKLVEQIKKMGFGAFVRNQRAQRKGKGLPKGHVPSSFYWLMDGSRVVGQVNIRHRLNKDLRERGGHIGYVIKSSERNKGYGKQILKLALKKTRTLRLGSVLLTVDKSNKASIKIIEANKGRFIKETKRNKRIPHYHYRI